MVTFRNAGPWGPGKGSNLMPTEVDTNFWELLQRLVSVEENPLPGVGVSEITLSGNMLTFHMSDGSTFGPVGIPVAAFKWREEWTPSTLYHAWDVFVVPGDGQYLVLAEYESPTEFDPNVEDTSGRLLLKMFAVPDQARIEVENIPAPPSGTYTLTSSVAGKYLRFLAETNVLVPEDLMENMVVGTIFSLYRHGVGDVQVIPGPGVTVNSPETPYLRKPGSGATLIKVGPNEWDLTGDLELEATT